MAYDLSPYLPPDQQMNANSLMPPQGMQPQQQSDPNAGLLKDIFNQYVQTQKAPSQGGIIQQILANRMQPTMDDTARSITQTAQAYGAPDLFKAATPEAVMNQRYANELGPYESILGLQTKAAALKNRGGATGELIDRLMQDNPGMSFQDALYRVQTGYRQGQTIDAQGNVINMPGAVNAASNMAGGKQAAVKGADLTYAAPIAAATAAGHAGAENQAKAQQQLPALQDTANNVIGQVNDLINHPALNSSVGGITSLIPAYPGTPKADFLNRLKFVKSNAFLEAFNTLRGGGAISDAEGAKATAALNRMDTSLSAEDFKKAGNEFVNILNQAVTRSRNAAQGNPMAATSSPSSLGTSGATHIWNPTTNSLEPAQ